MYKSYCKTIKSILTKNSN